MMYVKGFTLIELVVVIAILGILISVSMPNYLGFIDLAQLRVCMANRDSVEKVYLSFIKENNHIETDFGKFINENFDEVCPSGGVISYVDEKVRCSLHIDDGSDDQPDEEVPWM